MDKIKKRAKFFGNLEDINEIEEVFLKSGESSNPNDYVIYGNGVKAYPIRSKEEWEAANTFLRKNATKLPAQFKVLMSKKLLEKAAGYNITIFNNDKLLKYAGIGYPIEDDIAKELNKRAELYREPDLTKLAQAIKDTPTIVFNDEYCNQLIDLMQDYDNKYAEFLGDVYEQGLVSEPDDVVYTLSYKQAEELLNDTVKLKTGEVYSMDDLSHVTLADVREMFGDEVGDEVSSGLGVDTEKLADVLRELPLPEAEIFDAKMKEKDTDSLD